MSPSSEWHLRLGSLRASLGIRTARLEGPRSLEQTAVVVPTPFAESMRSVIAQLRASPPTHSQLNRAAVRIDRLGRELHGLALPGDAEIGPRLSAAIATLTAAHSLPEGERAGAVGSAAEELEAALLHAETPG